MGINIAEKNEITLSPSAVFRRSHEISKEPQPLSDKEEKKEELNDEFSPQNYPAFLEPDLKTEKGDSVWEVNRKWDIWSKLKKEYTYYSITRDLEFGFDSARVRKLQQIADKMCDGTEISARVVIMNKGEAVNAFACPDGTIFMTQSLLNRLGTEDEVAAVLGHELGHLIYESHRYIAGASNDLEKLGIGFVHEAASDSKASLLLQKAGYNSFAFASAIRKIQGAERDTVHMSGLTRASANVGEHFFRDSSTAHQEEKPLDQMFHREAKKTNLEIVKAAAQNKDFQPDQLQEMITKLHQRDLKEIYGRFWGSRKTNYEFVKRLNELVISRLEQAGYKPEQAVLMLYANPSISLFYNVPEDCYLVDTPEKLNQVVDSLQEFDSDKDTYTKMFQLIFDQDLIRRASGTLRILDLISNYLYNSEVSPQGKGIGVTGISLIELLQKTDKVKLDNSIDNAEREDRNTMIVKRFISETYWDHTRGALFPKEQAALESFLTLLKKSSISFDERRIAENFYVKPNMRAGHDPDGRKQAICEAVCRILEVEINEETFDFSNIDNFFETYLNPRESDLDKARDLAVLIKKIKQHFSDNHIEAKDQIKYFNYFNQKINQGVIEKFSNIHYEPYCLTLFEQVKSTEQPESPLLTQALMRFNFKTVLAMGLFTSDSEEFYQYLGSAMSEFEQVIVKEGVNPEKLSKIQLINLCENVFHNPDYYNDELYLYGRFEKCKVNTGERYSGKVGKVGIRDYDRFFKLPLVKLISEKEDVFQATTVEELLNQASAYLAAIQFSGLQKDEKYNLLADGALNLILGRGIMTNFDSLIAQGVGDTELGSVYAFVDRFYPMGVEKDLLLRNINIRYLKSTEVPFESKLNYLDRYGEQVGYEGVAIVIDQVEDLATYRVFRKRLGNKLERYLHGNANATKVALADNLSAKIVKDFKELLTTCQADSLSMESVSTWYSRMWMRAALGEELSGAVNYDQTSEKFIVSDRGREVFQSVADTFTKLQNLSPAQRFAIAHKALFEENGAFASVENRKYLAENLVTSLGITQEFVRDVLYTGTVEGDAEYIGFPAANMIGSLFFRAFDIKSVNLDEIKNEPLYRSDRRDFKIVDLMTDEQILRNLESTTRDIILFGALARKDPYSRLAHMAEESDQLYYSISGKLNRLLGGEASRAEETATKDYEIDPAMEAVIRGVESTGALGIRALQLSSQFHDFSESLSKRLSEAFDANPGMSRVVFWENLHLSTQENPQVEQLIQRIKLGRYLGGGSLQTTYAATYTSDNGETKEIIIKRKNPSVEGLLRRAYNTSHNVLETVSQKKGTKESANYAKTGLMLIDLSQQWCIADINDRFYEEQDDLFRQTVDKFNQAGGEGQFYVPERVFTELKVKAEELASGQTVNQVLKDPRVGEDKKKAIVQKLGQFFLYQLRGNSFTDEDGKKFFLIHSDPHVGNYMADLSSEGNTKIGVIDRSLYLKLDEKDIRVLEKLIGNSNPTDFVYSFINLVLDRNKDRGITRQVVTAKVFGKVAKEYTKQMVGGKPDKFALLRTLLGELSAQGREAPLSLRLMIRNISALQGLMKKYDLVLK